MEATIVGKNAIRVQIYFCLWDSAVPRAKIPRIDYSFDIPSIFFPA
jgi:hypothetical protein